MDLRQQQQIQNNAKNSSLIGKYFWIRMQDNPKYVRTVYFKLNPFTNKIDRHFSNELYSEPPIGVEELPPNLMRYVGGLSNPLPYTL